MIESHKPSSFPTSLLCLVSLGVVSRLRPGWLAVELGAAARAEGESSERISRLVSRAIVLFEPVLATLTRRGRPPRECGHDERDAELVVLRELLSVASAVLATVSLRQRAVGALLVGAWRRLSVLPAMTQARFCDALGLSERTLRSWLKTPPRPPAPPPAPKPPEQPRPRLRRRRFDFGVTLPGTQLGADTTDLSAFGVALKLVAAQDIGGRDASLFDAVVVDDHESAELVATVLGEVLADKAGAQAITDQGTPYMAAHTRQALDELGAEHAPQREGDPCGKSTVERAFRSLKDVARPLLTLTDRIAAAVPALRDGALAKAAATIVLAALLRAYQLGARAARVAEGARGNVAPETLARLAEESRERARATDTSARLLLAHVHELYGLSGSPRSFVDALRRYPIAVLRDAERALRAQVHRDDIRDRRSYFAAIVRRLHEEHRRLRARRRLEREDDAWLERECSEHVAREAAWHAEPARCLRDALDCIAMQWLPGARALLADGAGLGLGLASRALRRLCAIHDPITAADIARGVLHAWRLAIVGHLDHDGIEAVERIVLRSLADATAHATVHCATATTSATLNFAGRFPRPPPSDRLRN